VYTASDRPWPRLPSGSEWQQWRGGGEGAQIGCEAVFGESCCSAPPRRASPVPWRIRATAPGQATSVGQNRTAGHHGKCYGGHGGGGGGIARRQGVAWKSIQAMSMPLQKNFPSAASTSAVAAGSASTTPRASSRACRCEVRAHGRRYTMYDRACVERGLAALRMRRVMTCHE
jgi:hypothetical protein